MNRTTSLVYATAVALLLSMNLLWAQGPRGGAGAAQGGTIKGRVVDSAGTTPLGRASVTLRSASDSAIAGGAITDRDGSFVINGVRPGRYYAKVSFVGYRPFLINKINVTPGGNTVEIGDVKLREDVAQNNEITVKAQREFMTQSIDRTVYKTSDLKVAAGGSATDILRNIPTIEVDASENISLKGSQNVVVQINGRPAMVRAEMLATFLRGLPADAIERIEVIPNPSAKYDPDGMSGIINIVMKQNSERGISGGVNGALGTNNNYSAGVSLGYGSGPWNIFGSYGFNFHERDESGSYTRRTTLPGVAPYLEQVNTGIGSGPGHTLNTSVDYALSSEHTLSLTAMANLRNRADEGLNSYIERDNLMNVTRRYERSNDEEDEDRGFDLRLGHKWAIDPAKHELTSEVRFSSDRDSEHSSYVAREQALDGTPGAGNPGRQNTTEASTNRDIVAQFDYTRPLGESIKIEAGYKGQLERITSDFTSESFDYTSNSFVADSALNNTFTYDRQIHAAYATYNQEFGPFGVQVGLRGEQALTTFNLTTTGESFRNDYFSLFPSAFLSYRTDMGTLVKASYSRRINRPRTRSLNPFTNYEDPTFRRTGNPNLRPEYTDAYEVSGTQFMESGSLTLTGFYRRTTDLIRRYGFTDSNGISTTTWANFDQNRSYGADFTATLRVSDWLNGYLFLSAYQTVTDAENVDTLSNEDSFQWTMRANATATLMEGLDLQVTYFLRPATNTAGTQMSSMTRMDVALQQKLFDDRATLGLRVSDPFDLQRFGMTRTDPTTTVIVDRNWSARQLTLNFSYAFGAADKSSRRTRTQRGQGQDEPDMMDME